MIAPGDKSPPMVWTVINFFDSDYEKDVSTVIPYNENDENIYTISNPIDGHIIKGVSAKVMALTSMLFLVGYLLEKRNSTVLHDLFHSLRSLAYSSNFLNKQELKHCFKLTD